MLLSELSQCEKAEELLAELRDAYRTLDVFYAVLQDKGDIELASRIILVANTVDDCRDFMSDFVKKSKECCDDNAETTYIGKYERRENLNDNE